VYYRIMQGTPSYQAHDAPFEERISGQEGVLLRLLILRRGDSISKEEIARHLTRAGHHTVHPTSVPGYIARLRDKLGQTAVLSMAGYCSGIDETSVDAFVFEAVMKRLGVCDVDDVASDLNEKYDELLELYGLWKSNPALPFADDYDDELLLSTYREFEHYWECLKRAIIFAELSSRRKPRIEKAIGRIEQLLRQDPADEQSWALLIRARASLPGRESSLTVVRARMEKQFPMGPTRELQYIVDRIAGGYDDALFEVEQRARPPEESRKIEDLIQTIGISSASELELHRSKMEPLECISQTVSQLCFAGIQATKWVADAYVRAEFDKLLEKLDNSGGSVKFLIINPDSDGYHRFMDLRWSEEDVIAVNVLRSLTAAHRSFEVRLYDALPTFRIILIDQSVVVFSPYLMFSEQHRSKSGWDAPHVVLDRTAPWPLADTFETLFYETWRAARPLSDGTRWPHAS
jgi:DNA-binding SARP family transcriptional activator